MTLIPKRSRWKSQREGFLDSLNYLQGRMRGEIKSFKTPWIKFDDAGTNGLEWNSTIVMGARPGTGKTLFKDQLIREGFVKNAGEDFRVLDFELEMMARTSAIREYSAVLGRSYKYLCSADGNLAQEDLTKCHEYAKERVKYPIDIVENPCTINEFVEIVMDYMEEHSFMEQGKKIYRKTLISIDHAYLFKKGPAEKDKFDMLYNLGEQLTFLKRRYPIIFIVLTQLNRSIDNPERNEDGKYANYILSSDIFGADALLQHADILVGMNMPGRQKIRYYGPERFIIDSDNIIAMHFLKCRNGDSRIGFFKAEFEKMRIIEIPVPAMQQRKMSTT